MGMFEKVNPSHPDKVADRIAGAVVDLAYRNNYNPKIAVEVLIGHKTCYVVIETDTQIESEKIEKAVFRIAGGEMSVVITQVPQDKHLSDNQKDYVRCGDNGIFRGVPVNHQEYSLTQKARELYVEYPSDGKWLINDEGLITLCQSNAKTDDLKKRFSFPSAKVNPLGDWSGGTDVDTGATNRKLGSDMGRAATGGGLHGKDLSKADVSVNIFAHLRAQALQQEVEFTCSIGDQHVNGVSYQEIVEVARKYVDSLGGFEKLAEWGLIR